MSGIIEGYNYDIFISYRQKDNKHDGWVTEFVNNLKGELESTFKEDISVYFDNNPHDGLLETHDVGESLKEKLKCLIFIPIISRTYCDQKSFAWEHEFKAFVEMASKDQFGLKVKLRNGNVASRVLPVVIHELDKEDKKTCESVLEAALRGIEFIYKEPGVNKPLPEKNPKYSIQVNKVANAIKEIMEAFTFGKRYTEENITDVRITPGNRLDKRKAFIILGFSAILLISILLLSRLNHSEPEKSIAVLPFMVDGEENTAFANGLMEEISIKLQNIEEFTIRARTSVEPYRTVKKSVPEIARELRVNYLIEGSCQRYGDKWRFRISLVDGKKGRKLWSEPYEQSVADQADYFSTLTNIAESIASKLKTVVSLEEKELITKIPTMDYTAYQYYRAGREDHLNYQIKGKNVIYLEKAEQAFRRAADHDSQFALAWVALAWVYNDKNFKKEYFQKDFLDSVLIYSEKALAIDNQLADAHYLKGRYYIEVGNRVKAEEELDKAIALDPNNWIGYYGKGDNYFDLLSSVENLEKAASLNEGPEMAMIISSLADTYGNAGFFEKAKQKLDELLKYSGDSVTYFYKLNAVEYINGNHSGAIDYLLKAMLIDSSKAVILGDLGFIYSIKGEFSKAYYYTKKYINAVENQNVLDLQGTHRIGYVLIKSGEEKEGNFYIDKQKENCTTAIESGRAYSMYGMAHYDLAGIYAFRRNKKEAYRYLREFVQEAPKVWFLLSFLKFDPFLDNLRGETEFEQMVKDYESGYRVQHERVRKWLEENNML